MPDLIRPYEDVVKELRTLYRVAGDALDRAYDIATGQGFHSGDCSNIGYARMHVSDNPRFDCTAKDPFQRLAEEETDLWSAWQRQSHPEWTRLRVPETKAALGLKHPIWVICPRRYAIDRLGSRILQKPKRMGNSVNLFAMANRYFEGEDLVFAIGDGQ